MKNSMCCLFAVHIDAAVVMITLLLLDIALDDTSDKSHYAREWGAHYWSYDQTTRHKTWTFYTNKEKLKVTRLKITKKGFLMSHSRKK